MMIRDRHSRSVPVQLARTKRANHKIMPFKGLVGSGRHMNFFDNWLKVFDIKCPGINITVPADHIKRVIVQVDNFGSRCARELLT